MSEIFKPETPEQVLDVVKWALDAEQALNVLGHGTKRDYGRPPDLGASELDLAALTGISLYEPGELVMSAAAGTPMRDIQAVLDEHDQHLAFEPPNLGPLLGSGSEMGTVGGLFACNLAGSRRISAGSARDHILGFHGVSGRGEQIKSGGRVVKNVTGFDMSKLVAGSFGTLIVMTEIIFKVLPKPEKSRTVLVGTADAVSGIAALTEALNGPYEVSGAAHLPPDIAASSKTSIVNEIGGAVSAIRVEGPGPSVEYRANALRRLLASYGDTEELHTTNSRSLWQEVRDVDAFVSGGQQIWRLSVPPADGAGVAQQIVDRLGGRALFDWGGGLIWLALDASPDGAHNEIRDAVQGVGGHATLVRASVDVRAQVPVFHPQPDVLARIAGRVKKSFDPQGVLCPGHMVEGV